MIGKSIITAPFADGNSIVTEDPDDHSAFAIEADLPLLRGFQSMMVLPITSALAEVIAIFQCCGFEVERDESQIPFPPYYMQVLKFAREILNVNSSSLRTGA
jgi:hypothetical protein